MLAIIAQRPRPARDSHRLAVLVLAAGASRRLGRPKQLVTLAGEGGGDRGRPGAVTVRARGWRGGMSASLGAGVRACPRGAQRILVVSSDQWRITAADLGRLVRAAQRMPAAACYAGHAGIPAVFPARLRARLLALRGDRGARAVLALGAYARVPMAAAADDLDTPADLARLRAARVAR